MYMWAVKCCWVLISLIVVFSVFSTLCLDLSELVFYEFKKMTGAIILLVYKCNDTTYKHIGDNLNVM